MDIFSKMEFAEGKTCGVGGGGATALALQPNTPAAVADTVLNSRLGTAMEVSLVVVSPYTLLPFESSLVVVVAQQSAIGQSSTPPGGRLMYWKVSMPGRVLPCPDTNAPNPIPVDSEVDPLDGIVVMPQPLHFAPFVPRVLQTLQCQAAGARLAARMPFVAFCHNCLAWPFFAW